MRTRALASAAVLCVASASALAAQAGTGSRKLGSVSAVSMATSSTDSGSIAEWRLPSVLVTGAPRTFQVVSIAVPTELAAAENLSVDVVSENEFTVLGPNTRKLGPEARTRFGLTIGIPAGALAGKRLVAEARFSAPGFPTIVIPIEAEVTLVKQISLRKVGAPLTAQAGSELIVPFEIVNAGNARATVEPTLILPSGWAIRDIRVGALDINPAQTVRKRVRVRIPQLANTGASFIQLDLKSDSSIIGSEKIQVEVFNSSSIASQAGPLIVSSIAHVGDQNGTPNTIFSMNAEGALYDSVRINAHVSQGSAVSGAASNAFAHLGTFQSAASLVLSGPTSSVSFGNTGTSFSDLTGLYPYGQGALVQMKRPLWTLTSMGALSMPSALGGGHREPLLGVRADRQFGQTRLFTSISHLADQGASARKLDAIGVGAAVPAPLNSTFKAEIAERRFENGSGLGWSSELERSNNESSGDFRITHAPGGSDAFARATNEVVANVSQKLGSRLSLSTSGWRTTDASAVFSGLTSSGASLRPQFNLLPTVTVAVDARSYLFDAESRATKDNQGGAFGTREQQLGLNLSSYLNQYYVSSAAYLGNVRRTITPAGQATVSDRTPRNYWTTSAGWTGVAGSFGVETRIEQTRDRVGFVNQQSIIGVHADQVVLPWLGGIRGEGALERVNGFGDQHSAVIRAGAAIPIVNGFALKLDIEKNSIFRSVGGHVPWIFGARFEHAITVPMLRTPGSSGYVFEDLNGNQQRDTGEPGVAGAIVRRGNMTAVADKHGKFRVGGDARQPIVVDDASLADGWTGSGSTSGDLPVSLSTSAQVELVIAKRPGFSDIDVDLSNAHIVARDSAGREWVARMTGPATATFESLPIGSYKLDFDLSDLLEPLVPRTPVPTLLVTGKDSRSVTVTLDPRPIRMWNGSKSEPKSTTPPPAQQLEHAPEATIR